MKIDRGGRAGSQQHYNNNGRNVTSSTMPRPASVQPQQPQNHNYPVPYEVLHPSLQRNAHSLMVDPMALQKVIVLTLRPKIMLFQFPRTFFFRPLTAFTVASKEARVYQSRPPLKAILKSTPRTT
jgi:hypothetical protein